MIVGAETGQVYISTVGSQSAFNGSINEGDPLLEELEQRLGRFRFVVREAQKIVPIGSDGHYCSCVPPLHPYVCGEGNCHQVSYLLHQEEQASSFLDVPGVVGNQFLRRVAQQAFRGRDGEDASQLVVGINISSKNREELDRARRNGGFGFFPDLHVAQSIPLIHAHVLSLPPDFKSLLRELDFHNPEDVRIIEAKFAQERGMTGEEINRESLEEIVNQMVFDEPSIGNWRGKRIKEAIEEKLGGLSLGDWLVRWRLPVNNGQLQPCPPYGLEISLPFADLSTTLGNFGEKIWQTISGLETKLRESYGLNAYNFTALFIEEDGAAKVIFCPHDMVRAGVMEAMGVILYRPGREKIDRSV